jgi:Cyanate lyase C-terminal domain
MPITLKPQNNLLKALIEEEFGDGIMSAINFDMDITRKADPKGDRVSLGMTGKFLPYNILLRDGDCVGVWVEGRVGGEPRLYPVILRRPRVARTSTIRLVMMDAGFDGSTGVKFAKGMSLHTLRECYPLHHL